MRQISAKVFALAFSAGLITNIFISHAARGEEPTPPPRSVEQFLERRSEYDFARVCTNGAGRVAWVIFRKVTPQTEGLRFVVLPDRVASIEPVTVEADTMLTIDTGDYLGAHAQRPVARNVTRFRAASGAMVSVVDRVGSDVFDYSTFSSPTTRQPIPLRCTPKFVNFDNVPRLAAELAQTTPPRPASVTDTDAAKRQRLEDFVMRQVPQAQAPVVQPVR